MSAMGRGQTLGLNVRNWAKAVIPFADSLAHVDAGGRPIQGRCAVRIRLVAPFGDAGDRNRHDL